MRASELSYSKWRPHPWHGLEAGPNPPEIVNAFVEITPFDSVKYEIDKLTGYLTVDRPQLSSSLPPTNYGFIPRTFCSARVASLSKKAKFGDEDPLDICVYSERPINRAEVILTAKVVGAIKTIDGGKADDKIIAVLKNDAFWNTAEDIHDLPEALIQRLKHYFSTYKKLPDQKNKVFIESLAGVKQACKIIEAAMEDYKENFLSGDKSVKNSQIKA
jgi:inorganic pyrophosphatase